MVVIVPRFTKDFMLMSNVTRRLRGPGIALVVLALSAGVAFAGSTGLPANTAGVTPANADKPATEEPTEATETQEPTETPEAPEVQAPTTQDAPDTTASDAHGALVSAAAQMVTPAGFANHGAFVSCVAHMKDMTVATIDWTKVTPESCGAATAPANAKAQAGKANGAAGKAKGAANHAAAVAKHTPAAGS